ncbi:MAG: hypothetical protein AAB385_01280 [Planctomycetota bacterium]
MTEEQAVIIAEAMGGNAWQSGGDTWLVVRERTDGRLVVMSDECVCEYVDQDAFDRAQVSNSVLLV